MKENNDNMSNKNNLRRKCKCYQFINKKWLRV
jgi:hypothetical protein